ncbi:MAG: hypothetical protein IT323_05220, partial [Anaerolineae bacterium]|nr:hypothetical protein [Anaerolineae bacterium]
MVLAALAVAGGGTTPVLARPDQQELPVRLTVDVGFDGYFRSGDWVPVRINVSNDGSDIQGELRASATDLYGSPVDVYSVPIDLPTQSAKRIFLYLPLNEASQEVHVELAARQHVLAAVVD